MKIENRIIKDKAQAVGFTACGIAEATAIPRDEFLLEEWLSDGCNADMHYMEEHVDMRYDPRLLMKGARSVISLLVAYKPDRRMVGPFQIAQYAYGEDYHECVKRMLYKLIGCLKEKYPDIEARPFVDTAPISDRHWAQRAGLGWIGRNSLLINPTYGSYCFIGDIVTTAEVDFYDQPCRHDCGDCNRCIQACPNHAILFAKQKTFIDASRCTSYNTIENRNSELPENLETRGYVYGCDICQLVCPYNQQAPVSQHLSDERKAQLEALPYATENEFKHFVKHSAINRVKYSQWQRNVAFVQR